MGSFISEVDLRPWISGASGEQLASLIDLAEGQALAVAPKLSVLELNPDQLKAVKGILVAVIRRWWDAGSGAMSSRTVGPFSQTLSATAVVGQLYPSEVKALGRLTGAGRVFSFSIDSDSEPAYPSWVINAPTREEV